MKYLPIFCMLPFFLLQACGSTTSSEALSVENTHRLVEMEKGPCFGRCPIFTLTVYENGVVRYVGERFSDRMGTWGRNLTEEELLSIKELVGHDELWRMPSDFPTRIPDLPLVTITIFEDGETHQKSIAGREGRPALVVDLEAALDDLLQRGEWIELEAFDYGLPEGALPDHLAILLYPRMYIQDLEYRYSQQDLRFQKRLADTSAFWLATFDPQVTHPQEMQYLLQADTAVRQVEFYIPPQKKKKN